MSDRYQCSACKGTWDMDELPVRCPHCGGAVIGGYQTIREVGVREQDTNDDLPEFEELIGQ